VNFEKTFSMNPIPEAGIPVDFRIPIKKPDFGTHFIMGDTKKQHFLRPLTPSPTSQLNAFLLTQINTELKYRPIIFVYKSHKISVEPPLIDTHFSSIEPRAKKNQYTNY